MKSTILKKLLWLLVILVLAFVGFAYLGSAEKLNVLE